MNKIFYIMGKSATGKDKIYGLLLNSMSDTLKKLITYTTRPKRYDEVDGKEYYFVDEEKLNSLKNQGRLIESRSYHTIHGVWTYFTADDGQIRLEENSYLGIGTLESYEKMVEYFGKEKVCPIYIQVEDGERLHRAIRREDKEANPKYAELCRRFLADCEDFSEEKISHAKINKRFENVNLELCLNEIKEYIKENL